MKQRIADFFAKMKTRRVAFIGVGVSNNDCIRLFRKKGIDVTVCDKKSSLGELGEEFAALGCHLQLGEDYLSHIDADVVVRAPGIYFLRPELTALRARGITVTSEMELFFDLCPCPIYAVTGSDGKTTTTTLIAKLLEMEGRRVHLGGNIGRALLPLIEEIEPTDAAVVELSSFQLLSMRRSPDVAVITNVAPNHLDVHADMQEYIDAKRNLYLHQGPFSRTVLNFDNEITCSFVPQVRGQLCGFSMHGPVERGVWLENETIYARNGGEPYKLMDAADIRLPGRHNIENYMTAAAATLGMVQPETLRALAKTFGGVEHRIEFVREIDGARWYNDSIASSPTRTIAGLLALKEVILIAGGYDKKIPYEPLAPYVLAHAKRLILMGATAPKIEAVVTAHPDYDPAKLPIDHAENMEQAVALAKAAASDGDAVLFSPASASFDLYRNFEERGRHFKAIVQAL